MNKHFRIESEAIGKPVSIWRRQLRLDATSAKSNFPYGLQLGDFTIKIPNASCRDNPVLPLSEREKQVLFLYVSGCAGPAIAERMNVKPNTVATYKKRILEKLGCRSMYQAITIATA